MGKTTILSAVKMHTSCHFNQISCKIFVQNDSLLKVFLYLAGHQLRHVYTFIIRVRSVLHSTF